ncbi:MAG: sugar ABC transporter permease [Oscillospiraceae bacterium]|nr:sugar ABC transporter permease [Oscillospiraceae bacterium]
MRKIKISSTFSRQIWIYWSFLLPNLLGVLYFSLLPMLQVLLRSFQSAIGGKWVGIRNYAVVLNNTAFRLAVMNTGKFIAVCIPLLITISLALAVLIYAIPMVGSTLRSIFLMPMAVPAASVVLVWKVLFHENGLINGALLTFCGTGVNWMGSNAAFWMLVISYLWKNLGYTMILWTAGLSAIPESIYEAAQVDGANQWQTFLHITLPNLRGTAYTITVMSLLNSFKVFREAWLVAGDYPHESMYLLQHLYNNWFRELDFDKIAAASVMTSAVVFLLIGALRKAWDGEE